MAADLTRAAGRVLVTGAGGFVGRAFCAHAGALGLEVVAATRAPGRAPPGVREAVVGDLAAAPEWGRALDGVDAVVHLAARVHVMDDRSADPATEYRRANVDATLRLAEAAIAAGVRRIVFASSVKAVGESTPRDLPFDDSTPPRPLDPYSASKLEAERALLALHAARRIEVVVLRPVLVVGPGARGNLERLARAILAGVPLPLGAVDNRRSLLSVGHLADALATAIAHPAVAGRGFLLADDEPLSTPELVRRLARALGRPARLLPVPPWMLRAAGRLTGRVDAVDRLLSSLRVDASGWREATGRSTPTTPDAAIAAFAAAFSDPRSSGR